MELKFKIALIIIIAAFVTGAFIYAAMSDSFNKEDAECSSYSVENCPDDCVICPPCEVCSSISCQTEEFCEGLGFDKEWYEKVGGKR